MARETEGIYAILVRGIDISRIFSLEQAEIVIAVRVMAILATTLLYRPMQVFLSFNLGLYVLQRWIAKLIRAVAGKADGFIVSGQKFLCLGKVRRVTGSAAAFL